MQILLKNLLETVLVPGGVTTRDKRVAFSLRWYRVVLPPVTKGWPLVSGGNTTRD
jgi:hypothetical protein